nr:synaptobrevin, longin-like domain protein [Tanacetum cinerariifolium]
MARLQFCDYHNMVAILENSGHNCLSPKSTGFNEFSSNIATALVCLATNRVYNFSKMIFNGMVKNVNNKVSKFLMYPRARIAQSSALLPIADEPTSPLRDVSQGEACPTISSLDTEQDMANIAKTSTFPHESTSRVPSFAADEGKLSGDDAPIKGRRLDEWEEAAEKGIPTSSGSIPTAGPPATEVPTGSDVVPTAGPIFSTATVVTPYIRRKGKEKMIESETPKKKKIQEQRCIQMARQLEEEMEREAQRMNEQIARNAEIARIHAEEELQIMIDGLDRSNEAVAKYLNQAGWKEKDFKGMTLEEIKENFDPVWKQIHDFIPIGSKEEA